MAYRSSDQSAPGAAVFQCYFSMLLIVAAWRLVLQVSGSVVDSVLSDYLQFYCGFLLVFLSNHRRRLMAFVVA